MARVVDVRGSGGELIVLGGALTLPTSDNIVSSVLAGSLRYDAPSKALQIFNGTIWAQATGGAAGGVASLNGKTGAVTLVAADINSALGFSPLAGLPIGGTGLSLTAPTSQRPYGTYTLNDAPVVPGTYTLATINVDQQGRLISATSNRLNEIVATDAPYNAVGDGVANDTGAINAWLGAVLASGRPGYLPPGIYKCSSLITLDLAIFNTARSPQVTSAPLGVHIYGAGGQQSVIDLSSVGGAGPAFRVICSSGGSAFNPRIEGIAIKTNISGVGVAIGSSSLADSINVLRFEEMFVTNISTSTSAVALQMNSCNDCRVSASIFCGGNGEALQLRNTSHSIFEGKYSTANIGIHITSGSNIGNVFISPSANQVNTGVVIDSLNATNNNFIGGQFVWNNGTGPAVAAINATAGGANRFIGCGFGSTGTIATGATGIIISGYGFGSETYGGLTISPTTGTAALNLTAAAATTAYTVLQTAGLNRWAMGRNGTAETGANAGSDWALSRYSDAGTLLDAPLTVTRSTGTTSVARLVVTQGVGFFGAGVSTTQPIVTGSRTNGAALASLLNGLATMGLITNNSTT